MIFKLLVGFGIYAIVFGAQMLVVDRIELNPKRSKALVPIHERHKPEQPIQIEPWVPWSCFGGGASALLIGVPRLKTKKD